MAEISHRITLGNNPLASKTIQPAIFHPDGGEGFINDRGLKGWGNGLIKPAIAYKEDVNERNLSVSFNFPDSRGAPKRITQEAVLRLPKTEAVLSLRGEVGVEDEAAIQHILSTTVRVFAKTSNNQAWYGSGAIVKPEDVIRGYKSHDGEYFILTNNHVAEGAAYISIRLANGDEYMAEVVKSFHGSDLRDDGMDIAILRVELPMSLNTAKIGDPKDLRIGQTIYTAGHSLALSRSVVSKGIITRPSQESGQLSEDIQSNAPISPGNSGGPMFNSYGEIVGLNTYIFLRGEDMTFAKPIDEQLAAINEISATGEVTRGSLGFEVKGFPLIDRRIEGFPDGITGAVVNDIEKDSPAERAGLKNGDVVTFMRAYKNGRLISQIDVNITDKYESNGVIRRWAARLEPGTAVEMEIYRKNGYLYEQKSVMTFADKLKTDTAVTATKWGFSAIEAVGGGLLVSDIEGFSPADRKEIEPGRYYLRGIASDSIPRNLSDKDYVEVHDLATLKKLISFVDERETFEITLMLADTKNPKRLIPVTLTRDILVESIWKDAIEKSWDLAVNY